ncbi:hypothetical protein [Conchiformibius kuhniae]|uniref:Phosphoglycerate mutase n=1 Tax=Conchiformibius kuhniae TaxID=211502 RepID=A0A8T9MV07_9NEIS|nr:hypothetical protein [Conchiformibius kuhniae]
MMLTLILPALLRPDAEQLPDLETPFLDNLLRFGRFEAHAADLLHLYAQYLHLPFVLPENFVYASPVWQQMGMHSMNLTDGASVGITAEEAESLCEGLNEFYRGQARFRPLRPDLWRVMLPAPPQWTVAPVFDVLGQIDGSVRAEGEGAAQWLNMQTEIQMWLHDHPMNRHRHQHDQAPINGIWLWNAPANLPQPCEPPAKLVGSNSVWAQHSPLEVLEAPDDLPAWQSVCQARDTDINHTVLWLDNLLPSQYAHDLWTYGDIVRQWDTRLFAPLWDALKNRRLDCARIITDGAKGGTLWLKPPPLLSWFTPKRRFDGRSL